MLVYRSCPSMQLCSRAGAKTNLVKPSIRVIQLLDPVVSNLRNMDRNARPDLALRTWIEAFIVYGQRKWDDDRFPAF